MSSMDDEFSHLIAWTKEAFELVSILTGTLSN